MDPIGNITQVALPAPQPRISTGSGSAPIPQPAPELPKLGGDGGPSLEARRFEAARRAAGNIANSQVLGTSTFVCFKDMSGQIVTRFRSADGAVKYIPEPDLFRLSHASATPTVMVTA